VNARVERLRTELEQPLLVTNPVNVFYLSGLESSNAALLVEPERVRLFTDFRYAEAASEVEGVEVVETERRILVDLGRRLSGRIAFEAADVSYAGFEALSAEAVELIPTYGAVERLRRVKDEGELERIRRAAAITDAAYERVVEEGFIGKTERELAWRMEQIFRELGAHELSFPAIFAAGANASRPHATPGERELEPGQTLVVDAGCIVDGYCSDCTRTFATGPLPDELKQAYAVCLEAQQAGLEATRAGAGCRAVDAASRVPVQEAGLGERYRHGLGHGVGLLVHEDPRLADYVPETDVLETGNVVTIEPGIYLEGVGGVRIEDLVVVTEEGAEVLSSFPKDLIIVD
jgi:Xaa-Pro aminopeptidase